MSVVVKEIVLLSVYVVCSAMLIVVTVDNSHEVQARC